MYLFNLASGKILFILMVIALIVIPVWALIWAFGKKSGREDGTSQEEPQV
jgi:zona occludens toxin (predicted ATPase)